MARVKIERYEAPIIETKLLLSAVRFFDLGQQYYSRRLCRVAAAESNGR
jgi:hypothetical protein